MEALQSLCDGLSIEWDAQCLSLACQLSLSFACHLFWFDAASLFYFLLAFSIFAPGSQNNISFIKVLHEVLPFVSSFYFLFKFCFRFNVHSFLNIFKEQGNFLSQFIPLHFKLLAIVSEDTNDFLVVNIFGANLNPNGDTF